MQPRNLDEARRLKPGLGFALYAFEPGIVTLEILDGDEVFRFAGLTEAEAWAAAFPAEPEAAAAPLPSVFD